MGQEIKRSWKSVTWTGLYWSSCPSAYTESVFVHVTVPSFAVMLHFFIILCWLSLSYNFLLLSSLTNQLWERRNIYNYYYKVFTLCNSESGCSVAVRAWMLVCMSALSGNTCSQINYPLLSFFCPLSLCFVYFSAGFWMSNCCSFLWLLLLWLD